MKKEKNKCGQVVDLIYTEHENKLCIGVVPLQPRKLLDAMNQKTIKICLLSRTLYLHD